MVKMLTSTEERGRTKEEGEGKLHPCKHGIRVQAGSLDLRDKKKKLHVLITEKCQWIDRL